MARGAPLCIGMSEWVMAVAAMVEMHSDSPRTDTPHDLHGCSGVEKGSFLLAVDMMSEDVDTQNRAYVSEVCIHTSRLWRGASQFRRMRAW